MMLAFVDAAVAEGVTADTACNFLGLTLRSVQRWRRKPEDCRAGPKTSPPNQLTRAERRRIVKVATSREYRELPPEQIVARLADKDEYVASASSFRRELKKKGLLTRRGRAKAPKGTKTARHVATGPRQVWTWDITYLNAARRGEFYRLYLVVDIWSRKIVGWRVEEDELSELASKMLQAACEREGVDPGELVFHADNGAAMRGSTLLAQMRSLGIMPSFTRPGTPSENAFSESLFRTLKYRPSYPQRPFASLEDARRWVASFVAWYNSEHLHSALSYVTPEDRHEGLDKDILARRREVYRRAKARHPERWSGDIRKWESPLTVKLNPIKHKGHKAAIT
ncbi:MAG: IS3 family transposase [Lentisphaeria bacterium]|nr:IS3 family transposase [Lentisphaeria bacterium]